MSPPVGGLVPHHRLRRLELTVTRRLDGLLRGQHSGFLPGAGTEPAGSREYRPGEDEVRRIDWAVTARTGTPHVRDTVAERELSVHVLADATASMDFGTVELEKRELAVAAVGAVGFLTAGAGNRLGADLLGPHGVRRFPPRAGRTHLLAVLNAMLAAPRATEGAVALASALRGLDRSLRRRGLVVVVSDFLDDGDWGVPLRRLGLRHQVLAVEVTDPRELELPDVGLLSVVDPETGRRAEIPTGSRRLRERFAEAAAAQRHRVRDTLRRAGVAHVALRTDRDWVADLGRHVLAHRRLALAARGRAGAP
ncbi:DUF58 domain-containing protein [Prauserella sp. PE36]|uniref:DUF58 domain-containing protein n=1 Tax=Prauserella sp. PE36 TaxID=1504709 RepID=UPI000DE4A67E|nr:DUF58 domain-containing protein [Prauserella sp. PE36]RBM18345.1 DUF58 domain-containing protein [Prauserella sp. PE36]